MPYLARAPEDGVSRRPMSSKSLRVGMCANRTHGPVYASAQSDQYSIGALYRYQRMQRSFRQKTRTLIRLCRCADSFEYLLSAHANLYFITTGRRQSKKLILSTNVDQKSLKTEFSIAICRPTGDKWQSKTLFLAILTRVRRLLRAFSIAA